LGTKNWNNGKRRKGLTDTHMVVKVRRVIDYTGMGMVYGVQVIRDYLSLHFFPSSSFSRSREARLRLIRESLRCSSVVWLRVDLDFGS
jgi:hypothetical protein